MRIAFVPGSCTPFHGKTLQERPLGGIETAVIRLAGALDKLGHSVYVFTRVDNPPLTKPLYVPFRTLDELGEVDVLVSVRELLPLFANIRAKQRYYWTGDSYDQLQHLGLGDRRTVQQLNAALFVSDWQAEALCAISGFPREKCYTLRNGVDLGLFRGSEERNRKRLIYSSTPFRGLAHMPKLFDAIKERVADAEFHVFSGFAVYDGSGINRPALEKQFEPLFRKLQSTNGIFLHGNVVQSQLAREFLRSGIFAYPNTFEETSCISAIEAMAGGCAVVTSNRGALPETLGPAGSVIDGMPGTPSYDSNFVARVVQLLENEADWLEASNNSVLRAQAFDWGVIGKEFSAFLAEQSQVEQAKCTLTTSHIPF